MENAEFEYEDDFEAYEEEVEIKQWSFPSLPAMSSLAHTRNACDFSTENDDISSFLDIIFDESEPGSTDDSLGQREDTEMTGSPDGAAKEMEPAVLDTKKQTISLCPRRTRDQRLAVSEIIMEGLAAPVTTNWDEVVDLRIEVLRREHRRSQVNNYTGQGGAVQEKPKVEEESEVEDGDAKETDICTDMSLEYLEECTPLQVFYPPYPSDITLPVPVPEVKIKMVRLSRTVTDILLRRTTPYMPPPERKGPKVWNTFQKVPEIDVQESSYVDPKKDKPKKKSFLRRLISFFRRRSAKVVPVNS